MFTKSFKGKALDTILQEVKKAGFDGMDFAVRPDYPVNPDNFEKELPVAAKRAADMGLSVPLITPAQAIQPDDEMERLWAAAAQSGAKFVKLGYWTHESGSDYWEGVDNIRRALEGFSRLVEEYGVRGAIHQHSGPYYGSNCCGVMDLVKEFDPDKICVYMDPGHVAKDGEAPQMAFDILGDYLAIMAVKTPQYTREERDGKITWGANWQCKLWEGFVDWIEIMELARKAGFDGPLSFHCEYHLPLESTLEWAAEDLRYLDGVIKRTYQSQ